MERMGCSYFGTAPKYLENEDAKARDIPAGDQSLGFLISMCFFPRFHKKTKLKGIFIFRIP